MLPRGVLVLLPCSPGPGSSSPRPLTSAGGREELWLLLLRKIPPLLLVTPWRPGGTPGVKEYGLSRGGREGWEPLDGQEVWRAVQPSVYPVSPSTVLWLP